MTSVALGSSEAGNPSKKHPACILLFSGKRKSGKDYVTDYLLQQIGPKKALIIKISSPIKSHWAKMNELDLDRLMGASAYKEQFRQEMITWSEAMRSKDPGYFCREAVIMHKAENKPVWIVSDVRRKSDIAWFREEYGPTVKTVRVFATEAVRIERGYVFTPGVDDQPSECDLDEYVDWDWQIDNSGSCDSLKTALQLISNAALDCRI